MTCYAVFGNTTPNQKILQATMKDLIDASFSKEEPIWFILNLRSEESYNAMVSLMEIMNDPGDMSSIPIYYNVVVVPELGVTKENITGESAIRVKNTDERFKKEISKVVASGEDSVVALVLLGDRDPEEWEIEMMTDLFDSGIEIRDLASAGLSVISFSDEEEAEEEEAEEEEDEEEEAEEDEEEPEEPEEEAPAAEPVSPEFAKKLETMPLQQLRTLAAQLGVENAETGRRDRLIKEILLANTSPESPEGSPSPAKNPAAHSVEDDVRAIVEEVVNARIKEIIAALTKIVS